MEELVIRILIFGTIVGGIWALVASGFSLIFGVSRILNFAHGAAFITSAYVAIHLINLGLNLLTSMVIGILASGLIGVVVYLLTRPIRRNEIMVVIVTLALALLIQQFALITFGDRGVSITPILSGIVNIFNIKVTYIRILSLITAILILGFLEFLISRTMIGKKICATSQDSDAAMLIGINVEKIYLFTITLSSILAGIAGILYAQIFAISPETSLRSLIYAFAIVILGGLGSVRGSIVGSFIVGYVLVATISILGARWSEFVMLLTIISILILKPSGLFGVEK